MLFRSSAGDATVDSRGDLALGSLQAAGSLTLRSAGSLSDGGRLSSEVAPALANLAARTVALQVDEQIGTPVSPLLVQASGGFSASSGLRSGADGLMALRAQGNVVPLQSLEAGRGDADIWLSGAGFQPAANASAPLVLGGGLVLEGLDGFGLETAPIRTQVRSLAGAVGAEGLFLANQGDLAITTAADRSGSLSYPGLSLQAGGGISSDAGITLEAGLESAAGRLSLAAATQLQLSQEARLRLLDAAEARLSARGGTLSTAAGSTINVGTGNLELSGQGLVLQGVLNTTGSLQLDGGSASLPLLPYLSTGQQQALGTAGIDPGGLYTNLVLAGSITSAAAKGLFLPSDRLLAVLGTLATTAPAAPLQLATSSTDGMLVLGRLASAGPLSLRTVGRLFSDVPSRISTSGSGLLSIQTASGSGNLNGSIEAGSGGLDLQGNGSLSLAGPTSSVGAVSVQALAIDLAPSGGIVSQGDLSLAATDTGSGPGLRLAGLLVAGGSVAGPWNTADASVQRQDIHLDPTSNAELRLSSASKAVIGGIRQGSDDTVVASAWLAAPKLSISSKEQPTLLHDVIARDRLAIHSDTSLLLRPIAVLELGSAAAAPTPTPTPAASLTLTAPEITLTRDPVDLVIEAQSTAPQALLAGNLSQPLTLALRVTTPGGVRLSFSTTVAAGPRGSLESLLKEINAALAASASAAGLPTDAVPSLGMRGPYLRLQLGDDHDPRGVGRRDDVAFVHQPQADDPGDRGRHLGVFELEARVGHGAFVGLHGAFELADQGRGGIQLLAGDGFGGVEDLDAAPLALLESAVGKLVHGAIVHAELTRCQFVDRCLTTANGGSSRAPCRRRWSPPCCVWRVGSGPLRVRRTGAHWPD